MRARMRLRRFVSRATQVLLLGGTALGIGCGDQLPAVALDALGAERVFLVSLLGEEIAEIRGPFPLDSPSAVSVSPDTTTLVVGIGDAALLAHNETFLSEHVAEQELLAEPVPEDCPSASRVSGDTLQTSLPPDARAMRLADDWSLEELEPGGLERLGSKLSVRSRAAPLRCSGTVGQEFAFYGAQERPIEPGTVVDGLQVGTSYRGVHRLADGRVLVLGARHLILLERGQPFSPTPKNLIQMMHPCSGLAVDEEPSREVNGKVRVVVAQSPLLTELRLDESGLELVETATDTGLDLGGIIIDPATGQLAATAEGGVVFFQDAYGQPFERRFGATVPPNSNDGVIAVTGDADRPFLLSSYAKGLMLISDGDTWEPYADGLDSAISYKAAGTLSTSRGLQAWTAGNLGALFRRNFDETAWARVRASLPLSLLRCAPGPEKCGWAEPAIDYYSIQTAVAGGAGRVFLSSQNCSAIVSLRPDGKCASFVKFPGELERLVENSERSFRRLHVGHGWMTVASQAGGVYEVELQP